jgi:catechol 2,3-dioxygenase-like lactoylglutathione lyase family enzyme
MVSLAHGASARKITAAGVIMNKEVSMLGSKIMAFIPTRDATKARAFYERALGLRFVSEDQFALVLDASGILVRISKVPEFKPQQFTILGWEVPDINEAVSHLQGRGVELERYGLEAQDSRGVWTAPGGAKVAWFKDPDGNVLSVSQHS